VSPDPRASVGAAAGLMEVATIRWGGRFVKALIEFTDPGAPSVIRVKACADAYFDARTSEFVAGWCSEFDLRLPLIDRIRLKLGLGRNVRRVFRCGHLFEGEAVGFGGVYFIVRSGCRATVNTSIGTAYVENLCPIDGATFRELVEEISALFGVPEPRIDGFAVALYYSAKIGAAEFNELPETARLILQGQKGGAAEEEVELAELQVKLRKVAKSVPPDQELDIT